jgi:UDPglucose--hexose-1-phosphate uridylyltransferase
MGAGQEMQSPEVRVCELTGDTVVYAPERAARPMEEVSAADGHPDLANVFCEGQEAETMPEVWADRRLGSIANGPGWRVRAFPNRYPAVRGDVRPATPSLPPEVEGCEKQFPAYGCHEVIVEAEEPLANLADASTEQLTRVLRGYQQRLIAMRGDSRLAYGLVFKNHGFAAGASQPQSHAQVLGLTFVPARVQAKLNGAQAYADRMGRSWFRVLVDREVRHGQRLVAETKSLVAICPAVSRFAYEMVILPKYPSEPVASELGIAAEIDGTGRNQADFCEVEVGLLGELARLLKQVLQGLNQCCHRPAYNFCLVTTPFALGQVDWFTWHLEIMPRTNGLGGFELGTGCFINPMFPEQGAGLLRVAIAAG